MTGGSNGGATRRRPDAVGAATDLGPVADQLTQYPHTSLPVSAMWGGDRRFESATYLTGGYAIRLGIEAAGVPVVPLDQLAHVWQPSRLKGIGVAPEHGVPFLTATQVFDIRPVARKWLAPSLTEDIEARYLKPGWVLVTCSGNVGDVILSYAPHEGVIVSHDLLRIEAREPRHLGYLYAFLRSRHGRTMLRSSQYGSIIKHLEPEHLHAVPVPSPDPAFAEELTRAVTEVFRLRSEAYRLVREAEARFAEALGAAPLPPPTEHAYRVPAAELFAGDRRLDAYHYNPTAERALHVLKATRRPVMALGQLTREVFGVPRFKHVYTATGIPYLDSEDIFKINPELTKFIPLGTKKDAERYYVRRGWLLMASSGQLYGVNGSVVLADEWHEGKILSNHVIRIVPDGARAGYLQMALGHPTFGRPLVQRLAFGTEVPEIAPAGLEEFPVVRLANDVEEAIADRVEQASAMRTHADSLENNAVARMERSLDGVVVQGGMLDLEVGPSGLGGAETEAASEG